MTGPKGDQGTACDVCGTPVHDGRCMAFGHRADGGPADLHIGRSWSGTPLEDECPCTKAPCGLVVMGEAHPDCAEHPPARSKSMRQIHAEGDCPGPRCCSSHKRTGCCDPDDCGPCCPQCPTCPTLKIGDTPHGDR